MRRTDPEEDRKRALMRQGSGQTSKFSIGGIEKKGGHTPRKPSMPKMPWDDKPKDKPDGR